MIADADLKTLVRRARDSGAILRTKHDRSDCIIAVSIGLTGPGCQYRRLGTPGAGWIPPVAAAGRLAEIIESNHTPGSTE